MMLRTSILISLPYVHGSTWTSINHDYSLDQGNDKNYE